MDIEDGRIKFEWPIRRMRPMIMGSLVEDHAVAHPMAPQHLTASRTKKISTDDIRYPHVDGHIIVEDEVAWCFHQLLLGSLPIAFVAAYQGPHHVP
jgi:hypothetical protein